MNPWCSNLAKQGQASLGAPGPSRDTYIRGFLRCLNGDHSTMFKPPTGLQL